MSYSVLVLGTGRQGLACAYDLAKNPDVKTVGLADANPKQTEAALATLTKLLPEAKDKFKTHTADVENAEAIKTFLKPYDVLISAVPYFYNVRLTQWAIETKTHMIDMGGNTDIVFEQRAFSEVAKAAGVTILPDGGLAPGMANILAADGIQQLDSVDSVEIRVGGLPQNPQPPMNYQLFFSVHGLINEYIGETAVLRKGKRVMLETLTELETLSFDEPGFEKLEAFLTLGGLSTLPWTFENKVNTMTYKTIRYPGHCEQIRLLNDLGLFSEEPITVNGASITPRAATAQTLVNRLSFDDNRDVVLVKTTVTGQSNGENKTLTYEIVDRYDEATGFTAMMRTTAYPVAIIAQMMGDGTIMSRGVLGLEEAVPTGEFITQLQARNIPLKIKNKTAILSA